MKIGDRVKGKEDVPRTGGKVGTIGNATHLLKCRHCIGYNKQDYYMGCLVLKDMGGDRLKVLVFGERNWKNREHIKRIRYVDSHRVITQS